MPAGGAAVLEESRARFSALLEQLWRQQPDIAGRDAPGLSPGARVGRFEILRELGRGGFGVVYEAFDPDLGRKVAIKTLRPSRCAMDEAQRRRLRDEAEAVARLDHPAILTVFDAGTTDGGPYLVLELLRGEPLDAKLARGPLPPRDALRLATEVARALAHAHGRGVLHRDLKPANIFITDDGRVKLLDFGLAHLVGSVDRNRGGTPAYMAPEQARGEQVDARADVFALGVMTYEALEGRRPFEVREGRSAVLDGALPVPLSPVFPAPLAAFIARCLAPDPARRPGSGQAVLEELLAFERALTRDPSAAEPELPTTSLAKIARPRLPQVLARERLFRRLDELGRARRVVWVQGPPGAGKTTLVASYLIARKLRTLWYQVDEGDAEVGTFFHYLGVAGRKTVPRMAALPTFRAENAGNLDAFARRWFRDLYAHLGKRFAIVLDNYQTVGADAPLHAVVRDALEELPSGARAIVLSRTDPAPALARLRADAMSVLTSDELRLTLEESRGIADVRLRGRPADGGAIDRLHDRIQGWAAGLVLLLEREQGASSEPAPEERREAVFDYFAGEIFDRADPMTQQVLLEAALLPRFTGPMVQQLSGNGRAGQILAQLARRGYFTTRSGEREAHYQFHPLFREFLLGRWARTSPPDRMAALRVAAASVLRAAGEVEEAVALYCQAERWADAADIVLGEARALHHSGRGETLGRWIASLPADVCDAKPWLHFWSGTARLGLDSTRRLALGSVPSRRHFERSFELLSAAGDAAGAYVSFTAAVISLSAETWGDADELVLLDAWIQRFEQLRTRFPSAPTKRIETRAMLGYLSALLMRRPGHPDHPRWREQVERLALGHEDVSPTDRIGAGGMLTQAMFATGELWHGRELIAAVGPIARRDHIAPFVAIAWLMCEATLHVFGGRPRAALRAAREAHAKAEESATRGLDWMLHWAEALAWLTDDATAEARAALDRVRPARAASRLNDPPFDLAEGVVSLRVGELDRARDRADIILAVGSRTGTPAFTIWGHLLAARVAERQGRIDAMGEHLGAARQAGTRANIAVADYVASLVQVLVALERGERERLADDVRQALALGRQRHVAMHHIWFTRRETAEICRFAVEHGIEPDHARRLMEREPP